ncbi:MAG: sugar phosphate nucleotidyltransferase [Sodalis sp. (in: enterobacteria)]|uniref:sugar phosphate nucleotidyltransferase n=1 Tax=Sodalis sp. (in: enterobacteria) TaxID=1898979 RepID=UPI003F344419
MINIIIPMCGESLYETSDDFIYPKVLIEIANKTLLEYSQDIFGTLKEEAKKIYIIPRNKLKELSLKTIIDTISDSTGVIVPLQANTKGAVCSCLMGIDELDLQAELIISSADHYIKDDLQTIIAYFRSQKADAGVLSFESVHPKWSFVKLNADKQIIEAAEKMSISRNAVAGLYYFRQAKDFVSAAKNIIRKDNCIGGKFYLSSCLNELVLEKKKIILRPLANAIYHNFYDAHAVKAFAQSHDKHLNSVGRLTEQYVEAFNTRSLSSVIGIFDRDASLIDPDNPLDRTGKHPRDAAAVVLGV